MEICLLDSSLVKCNVSAKRRTQAINNGTLHLLLHSGRIDNLPAVDCADHAMHSNFALRDRDLCNLRIETTKTVHSGNTQRSACGTGCRSGSSWC